MREHLRSLEVRNYSEFTVRGRAGHIQFFLEWLKERGITEPVEVTRPVLERYQRHLFYSRKKNGEPLSFSSQARAACALARVVPVDDAAESHPAQPGIGDRPSATRPHAAQGHPLGPGGRADHDAVRRRGTHRAARPGAAGSSLLDRNAASGNRAAEALRPSARPWADPGQPGQGQQGPLCAHRRAGRSVAGEVHPGGRVRSSSPSRTTSRCSSRPRASRSAAII